MVDSDADKKCTKCQALLRAPYAVCLICGSRQSGLSRKRMPYPTNLIASQRLAAVPQGGDRETREARQSMAELMDKIDEVMGRAETSGMPTDLLHGSADVAKNLMAVAEMQASGDISKKGTLAQVRLVELSSRTQKLAWKHFARLQWTLPPLCQSNSAQTCRPWSRLWVTLHPS